MSAVPSIGVDLASSLVQRLGGDCAAAAELAQIMTDRYGSTIDLHSLAHLPTAAVQRIISDFVARNWLYRSDTGWRVGPAQAPSGLASFLHGASAMRRIIPDEGTATAVVTMPPAPNVIGNALPATGLSYAGLIPTQGTFERLADSAISRFTVMTPFLNDDGLLIALGLFNRTRAGRRQLIIRRSGSARVAVDRAWHHLWQMGVDVLDYTLPVQGGFETFHAKILLADDHLAYVGSANMTAFARHSMELGILTDGRAARVVASIVRAVETIARPIKAPGSRVQGDYLS